MPEFNEGDQIVVVGAAGLVPYTNGDIGVITAGVLANTVMVSLTTLRGEPVKSSAGFHCYVNLREIRHVVQPPSGLNACGARALTLE